VSAGTCSTARTSSVTWTKTAPVGLRERRLRSLRGRVPRGPPRRPGVLSTGVSFESEPGDHVLEERISSPRCSLTRTTRVRARSPRLLPLRRRVPRISHLHGLRPNGKSKTIELFEAAFGEYCCNADALLTQRRAAAGSALGELARTKSRAVSPCSRSPGRASA
jgi:hypothetical protein